MPWTQRAMDPPPAQDRRLAEAYAVLGRHATIEAIAEHLDVSPRTVRRWRDMAAS